MKKELYIVVVTNQSYPPEVGTILSDHKPTEKEATDALGFSNDGKNDIVWIFTGKPKPPVEI